MYNALILTGVLGLGAAGVALCLQGSRIDRRLFAGLISIAVTMSLFSGLAWAAAPLGRVAPLPLVWALIFTLVLLFALKLYRELQTPPPSEEG